MLDFEYEDPGASPFLKGTYPDESGNKKYYIHQLEVGMVIECVLVFDRGQRWDEKRNELFAVVRRISPTKLSIDEYATKALAIAAAETVEVLELDGGRRGELEERSLAIEAEHEQLAAQNRKLVAASKKLKAEWVAVQQALSSFEAFADNEFEDELEEEAARIPPDLSTRPPGAAAPTQVQSRTPVRSLTFFSPIKLHIFHVCSDCYQTELSPVQQRQFTRFV